MNIQNKFKKTNTIYKITKDMDLEGSTLIIPVGCTLDFQGGSFKNGTINFNNTSILSSKIAFKKDVHFSGTIKSQVIKSSWFEFDEIDCIDTLKELLEISKDCTVHIENGTYNISTKYVEDTDYPAGEENSVLIAPSNSRIILDGTIKLLTNSLKHYVVLSIRNKENVIVEGTGSIIGDVETHTGTTGEWGHGIQISSSKNITVKDISISKCWGDGITVSGKAETIPTGTNILIDGITSSYNRRLGISLIAGDGIKLVNSTTHDNATISGTSPAAGLDIEPNKDEVINNVLVDNCIFYDNVVTYFPIGVIADKTVNVIIQNCLCNKHLFLGGLGTLKNNTVKYLYVNGCRLGSIKDNMITESLILSGSVNNLDVTGNTFRGLTNGGYDSCITVSASSISNVNINNNYFNLDSSSSIGKFIKFTRYVTDVDIYNSYFKYSKTGQLRLLPYGTFYNCTFETSGINLYNISDITTGAYSDKLAFNGCEFISDNSTFYIRENITDTYKFTIDSCTYYTKATSNTDFINYIGHSLGLELSVINCKGKSVTNYLINETNKRPTLTNNYNGVRYLNTTLKRPEYSINSVWYDSNGYLVDENRNSDGTLGSKETIVSKISQIVNSNKIYKIVLDLDLNGETLTIPANCTLDFQGGSISNGTIVGSDTKIKAGISKIFDTNVIIQGSWDLSQVYPEWFGAKGDNTTDNTDSFSKITQFGANVFISKGTYILNGWDISTAVSIIGSGYQNTRLVLTAPIEVHNNNNVNFEGVTVEVSDNITENLEYIVKVYSAYHFTANLCTFYGKNKATKGIYSYGDTYSYYHYINTCRFVSITNAIVLSYNSNASTINNNEFYQCDNCIVIDSCNGVRVENNTFQSYVYNGIILEYNNYGSKTWGNLISGNYFEGEPATAIADIDFTSNADCRNNTITGNKSTYITLPHKHILNCISENTIIETTNATYRYPTKLPGFVKLQNFDNDSMEAFATSDFTGVIAPRVLENGAIDLRVYVKNADGTYTWKSVILSSNSNGNQINIGVLNATEITQYSGGYIQLGYNASIGAKRLTVEDTTGRIKYSSDGQNWSYLQEVSTGNTANRPTTTKVGFMYFDTQLSKYICWNGTAWVNLDGTALT